MKRLHIILIVASVALVVGLASRFYKQGARPSPIAPDPAASGVRRAGESETGGDRTPTRSDSQEDAGAVLSALDEGQLLFLNQGSLEAISGNWLIRPENSSTSTRLGSDSDGLAEAPPGVWIPSSEDEAWTVLDRRVVVRPGEVSTCWVSRVGDLEVRVLTPDNVPIEGASVQFHRDTQEPTTFRISSTPELAEPTVEAVTDEAGTAHVDSKNGLVGELVVRASGYIPARLELLGMPEKPIEITLHALIESSASLVLKDAESKQPIANAYARDCLGTYARTDADGVLSLMPSVLVCSTLTAGASGYCDVELLPRDLSHLDNVVELISATDLQLRALDEGQNAREPVVFFFSFSESPSDEGLPPVTPTSVQSDQFASANVMVPKGRKVTVEAVAVRSGKSSTTSIIPMEPVVELTLHLEPKGSLEIVVTGEDGSSVEDAYAVALYREREVVSRLRGGMITVGAPRQVTRLVVSAPGRVRAYFEPAPDRSRIRDGQLDVRLPRANRVEISGVDSGGAPLVGMRVQVYEERMPNAMHKHPSLSGGRPTSVPGWIEFSPPTATAILDGDGHCVVNGISSGRHRVKLGIPSSVQRHGAMYSLYQDLEHELPVPHAGPFILVSERAARATLRVKNELTDGAVDSFDVLLVDHPPAPPAHGRDGWWQGWVPSSANTLRVNAAGFESQLVPLTRNGSALESEVALRPSSPMMLQLTGDARSLVGREIELTAYVPGWSWLSGVDNRVPIAVAKIRVNESLKIPVFVAAEEGTAIRLQPIKGQDNVFKCVPDELEWQPGASAVVSLLSIQLQNE